MIFVLVADSKTPSLLFIDEDESRVELKYNKSEI